MNNWIVDKEPLLEKIGWMWTERALVAMATAATVGAVCGFLAILLIVKGG